MRRESKRHSSNDLLSKVFTQAVVEFDNKTKKTLRIEINK